MLEFKKTVGTSTTIITLINEELVGSRRFCRSKLCTIHTKIDGTTKDFQAKTNRLINLDDELYYEFARIQREARNE